MADTTTKGRSQGRYDPSRAAKMPANGLASSPRKAAIPLARAIVPDPLEHGAELYVSVHRNVDVLELERSHKRISEGAYRIGREIQAVLEKASRIGSGAQWKEADRVDAAHAKELAIERNVDHARIVVREMIRLRREVGVVGAGFLREMLITNTTFADYARRTTSGSRMEIDRVAHRFRQLLEDIVKCREARGPHRSWPNDVV